MVRTARNLKQTYFLVGLQVTVVELDARVTTLEENTGGDSHNGIHNYTIKIGSFHWELYADPHMLVQSYCNITQDELFETIRGLVINW